MGAYKVVSFNKANGQLMVEVAKELPPIPIDVPIVDGLYITGAELDAHIRGFIPVDFINRQLQINNGVANADVLLSLVQTVEVVEVPTIKPQAQIQAEANEAMWRQLKFEQDVAKVLVKFGLLQSDPTTIPVSEQ